MNQDSIPQDSNSMRLYKLNPIYKKRHLLLEYQRQFKDMRSNLSDEERLNNINKRLDIIVDKVLLSRITHGRIKDDLDKQYKYIYDEYKTEFFNTYDFVNEFKKKYNQK